MQLALSLNYCTFINLSTTEWIACGRGAKNGLNLIIPSIKGRDEDCNDGLLWLQQRQWDEWESLGYTPVGEEAKGAERVTIDGVDLVDIENSESAAHSPSRANVVDRPIPLYHHCVQVFVCIRSTQGDCERPSFIT